MKPTRRPTHDYGWRDKGLKPKEPEAGDSAKYGVNSPLEALHAAFAQGVHNQLKGVAVDRAMLVEKAKKLSSMYGAPTGHFIFTNLLPK